MTAQTWSDGVNTYLASLEALSAYGSCLAAIARVIASQLDRLPQTESDWNLAGAVPLPEALDRLTDHLIATLRATYPEAYPAHEATAERFAQELKDARADMRPDDLYTDEAREVADQEYRERLDRAEKWLGDMGQMIDALDDPEWTNNRPTGD